MIFNGLRITTFTLGVINNLLFLHLYWLETFYPKLGNSILGKSSFDLMFIVSFFSVIAAIIFGIALSTKETILDEKKQRYYISIFLLNIFSFGLVFFVLLFMLDPNDTPWFG